MENREFYILSGGEAIPVDFEEYSKWALKKRTRTRIALNKMGKVRVSTIFIGFDYSLGAEEKPILFETMVFGGVLDQTRRQYAHLKDALKGHKELVEQVKQTRTWRDVLKELFE